MDLAENAAPGLFYRRIGYNYATGDDPRILNDLIDFPDDRAAVGNRFLADPDDVLLEERYPREVAETVRVLKGFGVDQAGLNPISLDEVHMPVGWRIHHVNDDQYHIDFQEVFHGTPDGIWQNRRFP